jgi:hypothetical protein
VHPWKLGRTGNNKIIGRIDETNCHGQTILHATNCKKKKNNQEPDERSGEEAKYLLDRRRHRNQLSLNLGEICAKSSSPAEPESLAGRGRHA